MDKEQLNKRIKELELSVKKLREEIEEFQPFSEQVVEVYGPPFMFDRRKGREEDEEGSYNDER